MFDTTAKKAGFMTGEILLKKMTEDGIDLRIEEKEDRDQKWLWEKTAYKQMTKECGMEGIQAQVEGVIYQRLEEAGFPFLVKGEERSDISADVLEEDLLIRFVHEKTGWADSDRDNLVKGQSAWQINQEIVQEVIDEMLPQLSLDPSSSVDYVHFAHIIGVL